MRYCASGAAPIGKEILEFFYACGVPVLEGWGMTETSTAATVNRPDDFRLGSVGKPLSGVEVKIAEDGEILLRGPNIFREYWRNPEATREALGDGWLHTGDVGRLDEDGFLYITGRKKDIIITAGGKNITPANLENDIKQSRWVSQCVVVGDRRPYLVALITLDPEEVPAFAQEHGLKPEEVPSSELYGCYEAWCRAMEYRAVSQTKFGAEVNRRGIPKVKSSVFYRVGIDWNYSGIDWDWQVPYPE